MLRRRSIHKSLAFLAVAVSAVTVPAAARAAANDPSGTAADESTDSPAPPVTPPPAAEPTPTPPPRPEPAPTTPPTTDPEHAPPTTDQEQAAPTTEETAAPDPSTEPERDAATSTPEVQPPASVPTSTTILPAEDTEDEPAEVVGIDGITRPISFPVLGPVRYSNDFGACRDGCARHHQGNDMIGVRMQPLLAAVDGTVTKVRYESVGIASVTIRITGDDGYYYNYFHVNNDTPGTDDGQATHEWQIVPGLTIGSRVRAGEIIGYMGDSGNAEFSVPHLHFEIRTADRTPVNPYYSLVAAQRRETCTDGTGAVANTPLEALAPSAVAIIPLFGGGRWVIDADGRLHAEGAAARIQPVGGADCTVTPAAIAPAADAAPALADAAPAAADTTPATIAAPAPADVAPATDAAPAPDVPTPALAPERWTVEPGDSLWRIAQTHYGTSGTAATVAIVNQMFDANRDQLTDPNLLEVGMELALPALPA